MLNRRQLMTGAAFGSAAVAIGTVVGARAAAAFTIEPMSAPVKSAFALACKPFGGPMGGGDHGALVTSAQATLKTEIARGVLAANAQEVVVCPICGCRFIVTADSTN